MSLAISSLSIFAIIFTFSLASIGLFILTGARAVTGIIFGIAGIRRRKALFKGKYASVRERRGLPLGQGRSVAGITIGSIAAIVFTVLFVVIIEFGGFKQYEL